MRNPSRRVVTLFCLFSMVLITVSWTTRFGAAAEPAATQPAQRKLRVGVYDSRAIAVAYAPTKYHADEMAQLQRQLKEAEAALDSKRAAEIKARGKNMQVVAHLQAFATLPVDNAMAHLGQRLPEMARDVGVDLIVARFDFRGEDVEVVDVTNLLVAEFVPSEQVLKWVEQLRGKKPLNPVDVVGMQN